MLLTHLPPIMMIVLEVVVHAKQVQGPDDIYV